MTPGMWKIVAVGIAMLALTVAITGLSLAALTKLDTMLTNAEQRGAATSDAKWEAEIARVNAQAATQVAEQAKAALAIQADAEDKINRVSQDYEELRLRANALTDDDACGRSRARAQLLPK